VIYSRGSTAIASLGQRKCFSLELTFYVFSLKLQNQANPICLDKDDFNKALETEPYEITQGNLTYSTRRNHGQARYHFERESSFILACDKIRKA